MNETITPPDRIAITAFESIVSKDLKWNFQAQPIVEIGMDATIEKVTKNNPTGQRIAVKIITGLDQVKLNKDGNFDYCLSLALHQYWSAFPIPVIIVLYDDINDIFYWNSIHKLYIPKNKAFNHKIKIKKETIFASTSIDELEKIIRIHQFESVIEETFDATDTDKLVYYCNDILSYCTDSIVETRRLVEELSKVYNEQLKRLQKFIEEHPEGVDKSLVDKEIKVSASKHTLATNIFSTKISNEIPIMVENHVQALLYLNQFIFPQLVRTNFSVAAKNISKEFSKKTLSAFLLKNTVNELSGSYKKEKHQWSKDLSIAKQNCVNVLDDYAGEISDLVDLMEKSIGFIDSHYKN